MIKLKSLLFEKLDIDSDSNWHGDERTQRQFVIDLASQNAFGTITISDIADALDRTRNEVKDNYARLIRHYDDKEDFVKIVDEVPFRSAAIYQLMSRAHSAPMSKEDVNTVRKEEEIKYGNTTGVFYPVYLVPRDVKETSSLQAFLNIKDGEDVNEYVNMLPASYDIYGDIHDIKITINNKMYKLPEKFTDKIVYGDNFQEFLDAEFPDD